jgi:hypothetical protein
MQVGVIQALEAFYLRIMTFLSAVMKRYHSRVDSDEMD